MVEEVSFDLDESVLNTQIPVDLSEPSEVIDETTPKWSFQDAVNQLCPQNTSNNKIIGNVLSGLELIPFDLLHLSATGNPLKIPALTTPFYYKRILEFDE